jgi:hypothetical protein
MKNDDDKREEKRESVHKSLEHLLYANPKPTADLFDHAPIVAGMARAVVMPKVQNLLDEKIYRAAFPRPFSSYSTFYGAFVSDVCCFTHIISSRSRRTNEHMNTVLIMIITVSYCSSNVWSDRSKKRWTVVH